MKKILFRFFFEKYIYFIYFLYKKIESRIAQLVKRFSNLSKVVSSILTMVVF